MMTKQQVIERIQRMLDEQEPLADPPDATLLARRALYTLHESGLIESKGDRFVVTERGRELAGMLKIMGVRP